MHNHSILGPSLEVFRLLHSKAEAVAIAMMHFNKLRIVLI